MSNENGSNGYDEYYSRIASLETRFNTVEERLVDSIVMLSGSIARLGDKVELMRKSFETAVPLKVVTYIFALVFLLIAGVRGIEWLTRLSPSISAVSR